MNGMNFLKRYAIEKWVCIKRSAIVRICCTVLLPGYLLQYNHFEKTIIYAILLGGDTDTIASMAGAIAGAFYGVDAIPKHWRETCEGVGDALNFAKKLHCLAFKQKLPQDPHINDQHHPKCFGSCSGDGTGESPKKTAADVRPDGQHQASEG